MTLHHAVEITLTRPATRGELRNAGCGMLLAASADRHPGGTSHTLRRQLSARLPVGILTTHYSDRLFHVALHRAADKGLRQAAAALGKRPQDVLRRGVNDALARNAQRRAWQLRARLENLLADHTPDEVLIGVADLLHSRRPPPARSAP